MHIQTKKGRDKMRKRMSMLILSALAAGAMTVSGFAGEAGTYSASAPGLGGNVTVTVTTDGEKITDVVIEGKDETPAIGGAAIETLQPLILEKQSADIDGVAGATITSDAVKKAAAEAIAQAIAGPLMAVAMPPTV